MHDGDNVSTDSGERGVSYLGVLHKYVVDVI